jgi:hypothetical protein
MRKRRIKPTSSVGPDGLTLAELIALRNGTPALSLTPPTSSVGHYL